jgi:hypothetical protein
MNGANEAQVNIWQRNWAQGSSVLAQLVSHESADIAPCVGGRAGPYDDVAAHGMRASSRWHVRAHEGQYGEHFESTAALG